MSSMGTIQIPAVGHACSSYPHGDLCDMFIIMGGILSGGIMVCTGMV